MTEPIQVLSKDNERYMSLVAIINLVAKTNICVDDQIRDF